MSSLSMDKFKELLKKARQLSEANQEVKTVASIGELEKEIEAKKPQEVDTTKLGISNKMLTTPEGVEEAKDILIEVLSTTKPKIDPGVAREIVLNQKQQEFVDTAEKGEDVCLIGAAGTGKTSCTGVFIRKLIESGELQELGVETKWLQSATPGVLITSFTRKAVNNIKRAIPEVLRPHVLTMHKVLEFEPVFYEQWDEVANKVKTTMKFEPKRTAMNPLPAGLSLVVYEESSMIGTDLYNMMAAAMPHNPQEIFIGDIRQLPPIFGPAILGFKMSLLPVVELDEVYRQALQSPIIRLAHAVLSGDARKFSAKIEEKVVEVPGAHGAGKSVTKKFVPSLEAFTEESEHGSVKFNTWAKKLSPEVACNTAILQFIAWEKSGYYNPQEDIILCPFNKAFGTIELNKGIQNYLGRKREATVHQVIAGFLEHYLAIGDRVLYDKEDAFITDIRRNINYLGKTPIPASIHLDRWGALQEEASEAELQKAASDEAESMDKFLDSFGDSDEKEDRVNAASHAIDIQFSYSNEKMTLSSAGEVNSLLGGNAITVHKMQGSEAESIFLLMHQSHSVMNQNELLYTAITRARKKLHIICEPDTFFKGVKSQKVRGITLADKIETFKGKGEYKEMAAEMEILKKQREEKKRRLELLRERMHRSAEDQAAAELPDRMGWSLELVSSPEQGDKEDEADTTVDLSQLDSNNSSLSSHWDDIYSHQEEDLERKIPEKVPEVRAAENLIPIDPRILAAREKLASLRRQLLTNQKG